MVNVIINSVVIANRKTVSASFVAGLSLLPFRINMSIDIVATATIIIAMYPLFLYFFFFVRSKNLE